jgi:signal transduction histidine kinase/ActR/RegA family two-component response regulator
MNLIVKSRIGMQTPLDVKIWNLQRWIIYMMAVALAAVALILRASLQNQLGPNLVFAFSVIAAAASAYIGGFGPGIIASLIGFAGSFYLMVTTRELAALSTTSMIFQVISYSCTCIFICLLTHRLRTIAAKNSHLLKEIDVTRLQSEDVLDSITDAFYVVDKNWTIVQTNAAFDDLVSERSGKVLGKNLWDTFPVPPEHPIYNALNVCMKDRNAQAFEVEDKINGRWYEVRAYPTAVGISVFNHDITERTVLEKRREILLADEQAARSAAEDESRMKEEFLSVLSHELRTPIASLSGWANLLTTRPYSPELFKEGLTSIDQSTRMQTKILEELLDISRINAGKLRVEMEYIGFSGIAEEAIAFNSSAAQSKNITISFEDKAPNLVVRGDTARLHQVISNLISNAIKFSHKGGRVKVQMSILDSNACCTVDDGAGIEPDFLPHVFERFRQANSSSSRKYGGLGLGLAIAKQLIELQGGTLEAHSEGPGKGSSFSACLPIVPFAQQTIKSPENHVSVESLGGVRILIVEDDPSTRLLLTRLFEELEAEVTAVDDAQVALELLTKVDPNLILSDVGLPVMDGHSFVRAVRQRSDKLQNVPAVALTAFARAADRKAALDAGFNAFHTKPVNAPALVRTIAQLTSER